ncbi:hypothetical protein KK137_00015 [Croceibacterium sp. LX-88]|uniref:REase AHJR-like domain-containing protein n=1 Tax=Croceibacterium selenioxidans TaxID=2838833 RepID=A0ABS5W0E4_9SPHN|nr:hypothetical protein [Croceibacterium selenioxidans]
MTSSPRQTAYADAEREVLERLRSRYEQQGSTFVVAPDASLLPEFLGPYIPDAIVQTGDKTIAIEVKHGQSPVTQARLRDLRRIFDGHPDWQLLVVYAPSGPLQSLTIPSATPSAIRMRLDDVHRLNKAGFVDAALVMGWSLLEACLQLVGETDSAKPRTPGTVVQTLAANGHISPGEEQQLRSLIEVRNRIVHGDVAAQSTGSDVELVLRTVENIISDIESGDTAK